MNVVGLRERLGGVRRVTIGRCWRAKDETVYAFLSSEPFSLYTINSYVFSQATLHRSRGENAADVGYLWKKAFNYVCIRFCHRLTDPA